MPVVHCNYLDHLIIEYVTPTSHVHWPQLSALEGAVMIGDKILLVCAEKLLELITFYGNMIPVIYSF